MSVAERLIQVFTMALELPAGTDVPGLEYRAIAAWDSVGHMGLVAAIEKEFDVMLDTDQILDLSSFTKAIDILAMHGVA